MKISELIERLNEAKDAWGDLPVHVLDFVTEEMTAEVAVIVYDGAKFVIEANTLEKRSDEE